MRAFLAIPIDSPTLLTQLEELRNRYPIIKWTKAKHLHLTLQYFEQVNHQQCQQILSNAEKASFDQTPFSFQLLGQTILPSLSKPKVFAYCAEPSEPLIRLAKDLRRSNHRQQLGKHEKHFYPHVTVARIKHIMPIPEILLPAITEPLLADCITLYESSPSHRGANYQPIETFYFNERM